MLNTDQKIELMKVAATLTQALYQQDDTDQDFNDILIDFGNFNQYLLAKIEKERPDQFAGAI